MKSDPGRARMERLAARRLCIFNTNFLFLLRKSKVSCNFIFKISKKFSAFKFSPKLWDKPARTALGPFLRLWSTQTFSALGSSMTSFALVIWAYEQSGSALSTALLSICSYAPYVLLSIFAGGHKEINRTNLTCSDIAAGMKKPIVQKQIELLRMRNQFPVFSAKAKIVAEVNGTKMDIRWQFGSEEAVLQTDFGDYSFSVSVRDTYSDTEYFKYDS